jgi:hypothetical protein
MEKLQPQTDPCQYLYCDLNNMTTPDDRIALPLRKYWWTLKRYVWYASVLGFSGFASRMLSRLVPRSKPSKADSANTIRNIKSEPLNLKRNEWVEVRSAKEIFATLDTQGKLKGLRFTPEMTKFCGKRFRVYRRLDKILLEATGELRKIRTPTVLLEGVICDGSAHGGCARSCFCFWREAWLKRVPFRNHQPNE